MSQGIGEEKCDEVGESYSLEDGPWGNGGGKELTFIELLLCSRHFTQISSLKAENQKSWGLNSGAATCWLCVALGKLLNVSQL